MFAHVDKVSYVYTFEDMTAHGANTLKVNYPLRISDAEIVMTDDQRFTGRPPESQWLIVSQAIFVSETENAVDNPLNIICALSEIEMHRGAACSLFSTAFF